MERVCRLALAGLSITSPSRKTFDLLDCWFHWSPVDLPAAEVVDGAFWLCAGDRYVVVDCGGGTVDLTVHQIRLPEGHLKELYKASGARTSNALFLRGNFPFQQIQACRVPLPQAVPTVLSELTTSLRSSCVRSLARISSTSLRLRGQPLGLTS